MRLETLRGRDLHSVAAAARRAFGDDAMILHSRATTIDAVPMIEVVAAAAADIERLRTLLAAEEPLRVAPRAAGRRRPYCVALVGPTGAGKTTTAAKLAVNDAAFGRMRAGFMTLDTHRAGAVEQLQAYADIADAPFEAVHDRRDLASAMRRLSSCDVVLVDTPGRGPRRGADDDTWRELFRAIAPDETHLVVSATTRLDVLANARNADGPERPTHALLTKLDEVADTSAAMSIAGTLSLPIRWVTDGQHVPADFHLASTLLADRGRVGAASV
jgi:flagellar biosynthesis protein FlhF